MNESLQQMLRLAQFVAVLGSIYLLYRYYTASGKKGEEGSGDQDFLKKLLVGALGFFVVSELIAGDYGLAHVVKDQIVIETAKTIGSWIKALRG